MEFHTEQHGEILRFAASWPELLLYQCLDVRSDLTPKQLAEALREFADRLDT